MSDRKRKGKENNKDDMERIADKRMKKWREGAGNEGEIRGKWISSFFRHGCVPGQGYRSFFKKKGAQGPRDAVVRTGRLYGWQWLKPPKN
jgi:hypothetical protein